MEVRLLSCPQVLAGTNNKLFWQPGFFFFFLFFPGNHIKGARAVLGKLEIMLRVSSSVYRTRLSPSGDEGSEEPR